MLKETFAHLFHPRSSNNHRPRMLHALGYMWLSVIVLGSSLALHLLQSVSPQTGWILGYASDITAQKVIQATNDERAKNNLPPLKVNSELSAAALAKGQDMFDDQYWAHTAPDGTEPWDFIHDAEYSYSVAGENLARDFLFTPDMISAWMASPTHRANILNSKYQEIGIAVIDGVLEDYETTLVVQIFGTQSGVAGVVDRLEAQPRLGDATSDLIPEGQLNLVAQVDAQNTKNSIESFAVSPSLENYPLITPLQLSKALFLAVIILVVSLLIYDFLIVGHHHRVRLVGKNLAHIMILLLAAFLVVYFKGGLVI